MTNLPTTHNVVIFIFVIIKDIFALKIEDSILNIKIN